MKTTFWGTLRVIELAEFMKALFDWPFFSVYIFVTLFPEYYPKNVIKQVIH